MTEPSVLLATETIDESLLNLDLHSNGEILDTLLTSQQRAIGAIRQARAQLDMAVSGAAERLKKSNGRLVMIGAGASGRIAVQDGAELWPTFSWPHERLLCVMAGGTSALMQSIEGVEDDAKAAAQQVSDHAINEHDVVLGVAASGKSPWSCEWLSGSSQCGALTIGVANNVDTPLLIAADCPVFLDTGPEVLAGSTRMAAGTAQKIALNLFSTTLMIRMNRTYGNLMVDMGAVNVKLDQRRIHLLQAVISDIDDQRAADCLAQAGGWVKLAALVARGDNAEQGQVRLAEHDGSLRKALESMSAEHGG